MSEANQLLTHLAVDRKLAASTQNQALSAIVFLYKYIFQMPLQDKQLSPFAPVNPSEFLQCIPNLKLWK